MSYPLAAVLVSGGVWLAACGGKTGDTGGETHWQKTFLAACVSDSHCEAPLTCIRNLCTRPCTDDDGCDLADGALCDEVGRCILPERAGCTSAEPCSENHEGWMCDEVPVDACRTDVAVCRDGAWIGGALDTCRGALVETVPASDGVPETVLVKRSETDAPVDVLFVVDNSTSMGEQLRQSERFPAFVEALASRGVGDFQIAVVTSDVQCPPEESWNGASLGRFATEILAVPLMTYSVRLNMRCTSDEDCVADACGGLGCPSGVSWMCDRPHLDSCLENPNGSLNSACVALCDTAADCTEALGPGHVCLIPSPTQRGRCVNYSDACPELLPPTLAGDDLALAPCSLLAGANLDRCFRYEQPLEAMRLALDPSGPNADQVAAFVRPQSVLAVIALTDEDDCSVAPGEDFVEMEAFRCGAATTIEDGGPLQVVEHYADFLTGLKPPGRVFFGAVAGDSTASDPAQVEADRAAFYTSKTALRECYSGTSICTTPDLRETADYGARLFAAVDALAPDSHGGNLCSGDWAGLFDDLGAALAATATRICLPRAPSPGFVVERVIDGVATALVEAPTGAGTWRRAAAAPECPSGVAVVLADPPVAGERLRFVYAD